MIYSNSSLGKFIHWDRHPNPQAPDVARAFLNGERELLHLTSPRTSAAVTLDEFLEDAQSISVQCGFAGELLISCAASGKKLMLTGKTAQVLRSYLDDEPVSMRDRLDMTTRRRIRL